MAFNDTTDTETKDQTDTDTNTQVTDADAQPETDQPTISDDEVEDTPAAGSGGLRNVATGAAAVVSAGFGLSSLTGTPLSEMLRNRQEIIGQIETSTGAGGDQVEALYGAPWHTAALMNGVFALVAVLVGGVLLVGLAHRADGQPWVRAVALGGVVLGLIGLVVAGGMYLDVLAPQPELPPTPPAPAPPG